MSVKGFLQGIAPGLVQGLVHDSRSLAFPGFLVFEGWAVLSNLVARARHSRPYLTPNSAVIKS